MLSVTPNRSGKSRHGGAYWLSRLQQTPVHTPMGVAALMLGGLGSGMILVAVGTTAAVAITVAVGCIAVFITLVALEQYEVLAIICVAASLLVDWYQVFGNPLRVAAASTVIACLLVVVLFFMQSSARPWVRLPLGGAWAVFLVLCGWATIRGVSPSDSITYFAGVIVNATAMFIIGLQISRGERCVSRLFSMLSAGASLVALHTILYVRFGIFLLATPSIQAYLQSRNGFTLTGNSGDVRAGSFLMNPDWNGAFMALMVFLAVGLLVASRSWWGRLVYLVEAVLVLIALLYTYSTASWIAVCAGFVVFISLAVRGRTRLYLFGGTAIALIMAYLLMPSRFQLLFQHATHAGGFSARLGLWETAVRVILAHPFTGVGIGTITYFRRSIPYLVPLQPRPFAQPHEAFLEIAAMNGLPALCLFLLIVARALRQSLHNCLQAPYQGRMRTILSAGIAALVVLSINSLAIDGWTLTPLATIAWLILGAISSPLLAHPKSNQEEDESIGVTAQLVQEGVSV